ncbi:hypothetical protein HDU91_003014 [Kappamyces sp. JEL0680]|nr:hypothetical protein HDU91_003014 [Kappamyces sp. JEL0680]
MRQLPLVLERIQSLILKDPADYLPLEIMLEVLSYLTIPELGRAIRVSTKWHEYATDLMWKNAFKSMGWPLNHSALAQAAVEGQAPAWRNLAHQRFTSRQLLGHTDCVYCMQLLGDLLITGSRDHTIKMWDLKSETCVKTLQGHAGSVLCIQAKDNLLVSGSSDTNTKLWDISTGEQIRTLYGHSGPVLNLAFDMELNVLVTGSKDRMIKVWELSTGTLLYTMGPFLNAINAVQLGKGIIISAGGEHDIHISDLYNHGRRIKNLQGHTRSIASLHYDGKVLISGSSDCFIKIWDIEAGEAIMTLHGHGGIVRSVYSHGDRLVSGSYDQTIKVWSLKTGAMLSNLELHGDQVFKAVSNSKAIFSSSRDGVRCTR